MRNPDNLSSPRLQRIQRVSARIATACGVLMIALPALLMTLSLFLPEFLAMQNAARQMGVEADEISGLARFASFAAMVIGSAPLLWGLWVLRRLFQSYAAGDVFTPMAAQRLKHVAYALLALIIARPIGGALFGLALSIDTVKQGGQGHLMIAFGSTEIWLGLAGATVLVIAWIMGEAAALADENKSFV
jgi:hypothetical protein